MDLRRKLRDAVLEELLHRMPSIAQIVVGCSVLELSKQYELTISDYSANGSPAIMLSAHTPSRYHHIHIVFRPDLVEWDADEEYGPDLSIEYYDPELVDKIIALTRKTAYSTDLWQWTWKRQYVNGEYI